MTRPRRIGRALARIVLALLAVIALALLLAGDAILLALLTPSGPFDPARAPPAPDYREAAAWSALPGRADAADVALADDPAIDPDLAPVDAFYVHPTTSVAAAWNAPVGDPRLDADTDRVATRLQASAFNACAAVYAPRYRQATGVAFSHPSADGERAVDLAYSDVRRAFLDYLARVPADRPFILAAHSQGSALAYRLLREEVLADEARRRRLVVAYLIGASIPLTPDLPVCRAADETGCVVSWNARAPGYRPGVFEVRAPARGGPRVCVNPITWTDDDADAPAGASAGALFFDADPPLRLPGFASARCVDGTLEVAAIGDPPRDLMSRILDWALGAGNYHPIEYQIYFADLRRNAAARAAAFVERRAAASPGPVDLAPPT